MKENSMHTTRPSSPRSEDPLWFTGSEQTHRVAQAIAQYGPIARTTLSRLLDLSQGAVSRITSDLLYARVVEEMDRPDDAAHAGKLPETFVDRSRSSQRGRPLTALRLRAGQRSFVGINIHGTDVSVIATDALCRPISPCITAALPSTDPREIAARIGDLVRDTAGRLEPRPVSAGICLGGHVQGHRNVTYAPFLHWDRPLDFASLLEAECGLPCSVFNDLDSLLQYEAWFGDGVGIARFAVLTIGVGVGYSLLDQGRPVDYPDKSYGLAGHILVDPEGPRCYMGHAGCSQCLTTDSLAGEYSSLIGRASTFEEFAAAAQSGNAQARQLVNKLCFRLGVLTATIANLAMVSTILICGESSFLARMNTESIRNGINWFRHSQSSAVNFDIVDFSWELWAKNAAARAIIRYIG
jgi:predicted NBD/HSP70 family sugar kinase